MDERDDGTTEEHKEGVPPEITVYTVDEVARILRVGRGQLYAAIGRGELPVIRIGRVMRVPRSFVHRLLEA